MASATRTVVGAELAQVTQLTDQLVNLLLLAHDDEVELIQQIFGEAGLDFKLGKAVVNRVGCRGMCHAPI